MKRLVNICSLLIVLSVTIGTFAYAQSGRRAGEADVREKPGKPSSKQANPPTAEQPRGETSVAPKSTHVHVDIEPRTMKGSNETDKEAEKERQAEKEPWKPSPELNHKLLQLAREAVANSERFVEQYEQKFERNKELAENAESRGDKAEARRYRNKARFYETNLISHRRILEERKKEVEKYERAVRDQ